MSIASAPAAAPAKISNSPSSSAFTRSSFERAIKSATAFESSTPPIHASRSAIGSRQESPAVGAGHRLSGDSVTQSTAGRDRVAAKRFPWPRWESEAIPVPVTEKGLYLVEAANEISSSLYRGDRHRPCHRDQDRARPGCSPSSPIEPAARRSRIVRCSCGPAKRRLARIRTDASGLADVKITEVDPESTLVLARRGDDFAIDSFGNWNLSSDPDRYTTGLYLHGSSRLPARPYDALEGHPAQSDWDRCIALPARGRSRSKYSIPRVSPPSRKDVPVSAMGTIQGDMPLPANAALGYYSIQVHVGEGEMSGGFHVEEYKKPEYEVRVTPDKRRVLQGAPVQAFRSPRATSSVSRCARAT